jgi:hypothetical protein
MLALTGTCIAVVLLACWVRAMAASPNATTQRTAALAALIVGPVALVAWLPQGPLGSGWARKAGTPASLLGSAVRARPASAHLREQALAIPFSGRLAGTFRNGRRPGGLASVDLSMSFRGGASGVADVRLEGNPLPDGGVRMTGSQVTLGPFSRPSAYRGRILALEGSRLLAAVTDSAGRHLRVGMTLSLDPAAQSVTGTVSARPTGGTS